MGRKRSGIIKPHQIKITAEALARATEAAGLASLSTSHWAIRALIRQAKVEVDEFVARYKQDDATGKGKR